MSLLNKKYLQKIRTELHEYAQKRREVIKSAGDALHHAKRAVFALQRDNRAEAEVKLQEAKTLLQQIEKQYKKEPSLLEEGSYMAAIEEYVEAELFYQFVTSGKIDQIKSLNVSTETYLAGLADVPGELYRYAIRAATNRDMKLVRECSEMGQEIVGELIEFNLTSYLRNKFDQAKQAAQKLEQVVYEVSLRERN